ncbi:MULTISPECIES: hypothetical protein [Nocardioides]|uniref:DUF4352 domain-containing protein n=1 Tax=Nocardioides vastitatis TaxID=2568655 RepID=A0ABW0ZBL0_9ACTN|nr:hypothetical protein [Nocardioides sp.]THI93478.1 hypothetical protein E7Z54_21010 [Nocardioides sp.]
MRIPTSRLTLAGLALLAPALAGCGDEDGGGTDEDEPAPLGTAVEIEFYGTDGSDQAQGSGTVAITAVRQGAITDLTGAGYTLDPEEEATTPYYVDIAFQNNGDTPVDLRSPSGEDQDGNLIHSLTLINLGDGPDFEPCPDVPDTLAAGQAGKGCAIILVPDGRELEQISYLPGGTAGFIYWDSGL